MLRFFSRRRVLPTVNWNRGTIVVRDSALFSGSNDAFAEHFRHSVLNVPGVNAVDVESRQSQCVIHFAESLPPADILERIARVLEQVSPRPSRSAEARCPSSNRTRRRWKGLERLYYLAAGGACLATAVAGAAITGVPSLKLLLISSCFFVRSIPPLNRRALRSRHLGPVLRDWRRYRGMRLDVKVLVVGTLLIVLIFGIAFSGLTGAMLAGCLIVGTVGIVRIALLPTVAPERSAAPYMEMTRARLATANAVG